MELGRNLEAYNATGGYAIVFRWQGEKQLRRWHAQTHRAAMRKFNQLKKQATYLPLDEDITL